MSEVYSDIHDEFLRNTSGDLLIAKDSDAIEVSIRNILQTSFGERVMLPNFGSRLRSLLFDPVDENTARFIQMEIKNSINVWDNRLQVTDVIVIPFPDKNQYNVTINYTILRLGFEATLNFTLEAANVQ
jgi:phage baseplate assembly protein W